jgi:hypothetical protein
MNSAAVMKEKLLSPIDRYLHLVHYVTTELGEPSMYMTDEQAADFMNMGPWFVTNARESLLKFKLIREVPGPIKVGRPGYILAGRLFCQPKNTTKEDYLEQIALDF